MDIKDLVQKICRKHNTSDPYELSDSLGIKIYYHDLSPVRGYYFSEHRIKNIVLHCDLPDHMRGFVLSHEIGHAIMHPTCNTPFLQSTFFSVNKLEIQANKFAAELIIQDVDLMEHWDYSIDQWAMYYGLPREIIELRMR